MEANTNNQQVQFVQVTPTVAPVRKEGRVLSIAQKEIFKWAAVISYIIGFIYIKYGIEGAGIISKYPYLGRIILP